MTDKLRKAAQQALYAMAMLIDPEKLEPWQIELYDKTINALRTALAEQPAEQESMAVACQISALGDSWADFPLERAQEAIEHGLNVRYLGVLRQKPVKPAEQEPVAWGIFYFGGKRNGKLYSQIDTEENAKRYIADLHQSNDTDTFRAAPLYTAPQPAKREPLTNADLKRVINAATMPSNPDDVGRWVVNVCRAIERAHGIGGQV